MASALLAGCSDDDDSSWSDDDAPLGIMVNASWQDGRATDGTRSLPDFVTADPVRTPAPAWIYVTVPGKDPFYVKASDPSEILDSSKEPGTPYYPYHKFYSKTDGLLPKCPISRGDARKGGMVAYYVLDRGKASESPNYNLPVAFLGWNLSSDIAAVGQSDYMSSDPTGYPVDDNYRDHLLFTLKHRTALMRLKFQVAEKYLTIRNIVLRSVKINDTMLEFSDFYTDIDGAGGLKLTSSPQYAACAYINPASAQFVEPKNPWTFECTYDIYDKDEISAPHLVRSKVTATNQVNLKSLSPSISEIKAGFHYDLTITIDPDYLYVLSEHDNKQHLTIK